MFDKLKQIIHNLRPSVRKERIRLEAKQEILSVISITLGLDADGDVFVATKGPIQLAIFYVDVLSGILKVTKTHQIVGYKSNANTVSEDDRSRQIENYESI